MKMFLIMRTGHFIILTYLIVVTKSDKKTFCSALLLNYVIKKLNKLARLTSNTSTVMDVNSFNEYQIQQSHLGFLKENKNRRYKYLAQLVDGLQMSIVVPNQPTH